MPGAATALWAVCAAVLHGGAMASKTHVRSAVVTACVNCHRSSSTVGAVSVKRGSDRSRIDRTPLMWFQMLWAVGLATCSGAPAIGGTMCVGRLLLTKDGVCCSLPTTHACNRWNAWKCYVATTTLQCAWTGRKDCRRECGNCKRVHMRSSSVDAACRHLIASGFHASHVLAQSPGQRFGREHPDLDLLPNGQTFNPSCEEQRRRYMKMCFAQGTANVPIHLNSRPSQQPREDTQGGIRGFH